MSNEEISAESKIANVELWIEALRSGKYKRGTGRLRNANDTFCCLGVAADLLNPLGWDGSRWSEFETELPSDADDALGLTPSAIDACVFA